MCKAIPVSLSLCLAVRRRIVPLVIPHRFDCVRPNFREMLAISLSTNLRHFSKRVCWMSSNTLSLPRCWIFAISSSMSNKNNFLTVNHTHQHLNSILTDFIHYIQTSLSREICGCQNSPKLNTSQFQYRTHIYIYIYIYTHTHTHTYSGKIIMIGHSTKVWTFPCIVRPCAALL